MKVILLQDVAKIGRRHEIVNVPDGYALNQLIPKKLAEPATAQNLKRIEKRQEQVLAGKMAGEEKFTNAREKLQSIKLKVAMGSNEQGNLFQAVHEQDIVKVASENNISIDATMLKISTPIKEIGIHKVQLITGPKNQEFEIEVVAK